jgi:hypothetical protein
LQVILPRIVGPDFLLLRYRDELILVDLIGAVIPLFVCLIAILGIVLDISHRETNRTHEVALRDAGFWLVVLTLALASTAVFTLASAEFGGLILPVSWSIALMPGGAVVGVTFGLTRWKDETPLAGFLECYVLGTLVMLISDIVRTLSGLVNAPILVWGGDGVHDLVFWFGIYTGIPFLVFTVLRPRLLVLWPRLG